ncbi:hypothetical protein DAEQUDRAFT_149371 [Daedalea quercina L-15889]|uniref:BTB domain-containing protein n=1 Tax=Daedalea quercina L-15889 TaxID=1314783 RepID=A0A165KM47_9APHY|nr:hypothetical protein DAEQUDRAFT_149371 [Daedalea quercina L-15889]
MSHSTEGNATSTSGETKLTESTAAQTTDAPFPFNNPHADVILQSSDGVNFRVRTAILSEASPVFESMFSLPAQQSAKADHDSASGLAVVPVSEDSTTLKALLRLCYPVNARSSRNLAINEAAALLEAARKYDMEGIEEHIVQALRGYMETSPLRVYCLAIRYNLDKDLIRAAARACLDEPAGTPYGRGEVPELDDISASTYIRLLDYHRACSDAAVGIVNRYPLVDVIFDQRCWVTCVPITASGETTCSTIRTLSRLPGCTHKHRVVTWFARFMDHCETVVKKKPSGKDITSNTTVAAALADA